MKRLQVSICMTLVCCLVGPAVAGGYISVSKISGRQFVYRATTPTKIADPVARIKSNTRGVSLIGTDEGEKIQGQTQELGLTDATQGQTQTVPTGKTIAIELDHKDNVYYDGDSLLAKVTTNQAGHLYIFNVDSQGNQVQLFPNRFQSDNQVQANQTVYLPGPGAPYRININAPFGEDMFVAVLTSYPIDKGSLGANMPLDAAITKEKELKKSRKGATIQEVVPFSSDSVIYTTKASGAKIDPNQTPNVPNDPGFTKKKKRIGLFIGINTYQDNRISDLKACDRDAAMMAESMVNQCGLGYANLLVNEKATLAAIKAAFTELVTLSQPGDEVFVFWSGHGGTCADTQGEEADGLDEYLVPSDGRFGTNSSMLMDDDFDRLLAGLQGRTLTIILDTCHSGGISGAQKSIGSSPRTLRKIPVFDFLGGKRPGIKDVSSSQAAMLCSSQSEEFSLEREAGDLSVMTYCLLQVLNNGQTPLTFRQAAEYVTKQVPIEVQKDYPGFEQKPHWINQVGTIYLKQ